MRIDLPEVKQEKPRIAYNRAIRRYVCTGTKTQSGGAFGVFRKIGYGDTSRLAYLNWRSMYNDDPEWPLPSPMGDYIEGQRKYRLEGLGSLHDRGYTICTGAHHD